MLIYVFSKEQTGVGDPLATLSISGRSKKGVIETEHEHLRTFFNLKIKQPLVLRNGTVIDTNDMNTWLAGLPQASPISNYWFKVISQEEVSNDNETTEDDPIEVEEDGEYSGADGGTDEGNRTDDS